MNSRKGVVGSSVWFFASRIDAESLTEWFNVGVFGWYGFWNALVIQGESVLAIEGF